MSLVGGRAAAGGGKGLGAAAAAAPAEPLDSVYIYIYAGGSRYIPPSSRPPTVFSEPAKGETKRRDSRCVCVCVCAPLFGSSQPHSFEATVFLHVCVSFCPPPSPHHLLPTLHYVCGVYMLPSMYSTFYTRLRNRTTLCVFLFLFMHARTYVYVAVSFFFSSFTRPSCLTIKDTSCARLYAKVLFK